MVERTKLVTKQNKVRLLLDSGAYGAWSRGESIKVQDYGRYCLDNAHLIWQLVNLDVIPGSFGRRDNTQDEVERSADKSHRNQQALKDMGLRPIPVFHQGERLFWLEKMLREGETYIGFSPSKFVRASDQQRWLDMVFNIITDADGRPFVRAHGFAATSFKNMTHYPWRSVDSTTWSLTPGYGQVIIPAWQHGAFDYMHPPTRVIMSGVAQKNKKAQEKQYEALPKEQQRSVRRYIEEVVGSTITKQRYSSIERCRTMLTYYVEMCSQLRDVRFGGGRARIFGPDHLDTQDGELEARGPWNLILAFATEALHKEWSKVMNEVGAHDRLLSYWYLKDRPDSVLEQFVTTGSCGDYVRSKQKMNWSNETYLNRRRLALWDHIEGSVENEPDRLVGLGGDGRSAPDMEE